MDVCCMASWRLRVSAVAREASPGLAAKEDGFWSSEDTLEARLPSDGGFDPVQEFGD